MQWIREGQTENEPEGTPKEVWEIIVQCWNKDPQQRPSAKGVVDKVNAAKNPMLSAAMISFGAFSLKNAKSNLNSGVADPDAINNAYEDLDTDDIPAQSKRSVKYS